MLRVFYCDSVNSLVVNNIETWTFVRAFLVADRF